MNQKTIIAIVIGILVIGGSWYYYSKNIAGSMGENGEAVATVNGEKITRAELDKTENQIAVAQNLNIATLDEATRKQLETQALDNLISSELVKQAAKKSGEKATEAEIDTQLSATKAQFQDDAAYKAELTAQGISESELRSNIASDIEIQAYLKKTLPLDSVTVTDEEVKTLYDQEVAKGGEGLPTLSDISGQIKAFVTQQKQQQLVQAHLQELKAAAKIEILI
ncbi:MAG: SurA N-terminal domain-containing protein [Candidatus Paceibacterota bacterium]